MVRIGSKGVSEYLGSQARSPYPGAGEMKSTISTVSNIKMKSTASTVSNTKVRSAVSTVSITKRIEHYLEETSRV